MKRVIYYFLLSFFITNFTFLDKYLLANTNTEIVKNENQKVSESQKSYEDEYILGPGDLVQILIPSMSGDSLRGNREISILNDGKIPFIFNEYVYISGMTIKEAKNYLISIAKEELINPEIELKLLRPRIVRFSVIGEVNYPGLYNDRKIREKELGFSTLVDAIEISGGVTSEANLKEVVLIRKLPESSEDSYKQATLNLVELIKNGNTLQNPYIFDGDIIKIQKSDENYEFDIVSSNLSPREIQVTVVGEVLNPGRKIIRSNSTVSNAIFAAGGPKDLRAKLSNIKIVRFDNQGNLLTKKVKLNLSNKADKETNPVLRDGDVIRVNPNSFSRFSDSVEVVTKPFTGIAQTLYIFKLLGD